MQPISATFGSIFTRDTFLDEWVRNIKKIEMPKKDMRLVWVVSNKILGKVTPYFNSYKKDFAEAEMVISPFKVFDHATEAQNKEGFMQKRWSVAFNFNILYQYRKGDLFVVEDDVFPPLFAYNKLSALARIQDVGAASGLSYNWKKEIKHPLAWFFIKRRVLPQEIIDNIKQRVKVFDFYDYDLRIVEDGGRGVEEVHATCTGCIYIKEKCLKDYYATAEGDLRIGQDINLGWHITQDMRLRLLLDWEVYCNHKHIDEQGNLKER
jgi:hypothetical protein